MIYPTRRAIYLLLLGAPVALALGLLRPELWVVAPAWIALLLFGLLFDAMLGAEVAARLGYQPGDRIVLSHGSGELDLSQHADKPFVVRGILAPTGTPVDRTVHISLQAM